MIKDFVSAGPKKEDPVVGDGIGEEAEFPWHSKNRV